MNFPEEMVDALRRARRVVALTGAGVSAESGVPTFRDAQTGLWARYRPEELATPEAFARHPERVWAWYTWRRELVRRARPNPAHYALAAMERRVPAFALITQNVDGLHQAAGSRRVIELHGNLMRTVCAAQRHEVSTWEPVPEGKVPRCPRCGSLLRPDVVWFGEPLPEAALQAALEAAQQAEVMLVVGTSGLVQPAASLPLLAAERGAYLVEVNPQETALSAWMDAVLRGPAGQVLPHLLEAVWGERLPLGGQEAPGHGDGPGDPAPEGR